MLILNIGVRAVFNEVSKVISPLLWFCISTFCHWLTNLVPLAQPIRTKTKINCNLVACVFPCLVPVTVASSSDCVIDH